MKIKKLIFILLLIFSQASLAEMKQYKILPACNSFDVLWIKTLNNIAKIKLLTVSDNKKEIKRINELLEYHNDMFYEKCIGSIK